MAVQGLLGWELVMVGRMRAFVVANEMCRVGGGSCGLPCSVKSAVSACGFSLLRRTFRRRLLKRDLSVCHNLTSVLQRITKQTDIAHILAQALSSKIPLLLNRVVLPCEDIVWLHVYGLVTDLHMSIEAKPSPSVLGYCPRLTFNRPIILGKWHAN